MYLKNKKRTSYFGRSGDVELRTGVGLHLLQDALEADDFHFEPGDALGEVAGLGDRVHLRGLREGDADLLAVPPDGVNAKRLLLLRNIEFEHVRGRNRIGKDQPRAVGRDIADQAIDHVAAIVEVDHAAQKALLAGGSAAFNGAWFGRTGHGTEASAGSVRTSLPAGRQALQFVRT